MTWQIHLNYLVSLLAILVGYWLLVGPLRRRFHSEDQIWREPVEPREKFFFSAAILTLLIAELSPLHDLSEVYLFSAHMVQHLLMTMVMPPLLLLGMPAWFFRPLLRNRQVFRVLRLLTNPIAAIVLFNTTLAFWHVPFLYDLALENHVVHAIEHYMFMGTAVLFWWPIFSPVRELPRLSYPAQMLYLFVQSLVPAVIASFITFSNDLIYTWYASAPRLFDLSPVQDQQMGGLIMKIAGGFALWIPVTIIFFIWFNREEAEIEKSWE